MAYDYGLSLILLNSQSLAMVGAHSEGLVKIYELLDPLELEKWQLHVRQTGSAFERLIGTIVRSQGIKSQQTSLTFLLIFSHAVATFRKKINVVMVEGSSRAPLKIKALALPSKHVVINEVLARPTSQATLQNLVSNEKAPVQVPVEKASPMSPTSARSGDSTSSASKKMTFEDYATEPTSKKAGGKELLLLIQDEYPDISFDFFFEGNEGKVIVPEASLPLLTIETSEVPALSEVPEASQTHVDSSADPYIFDNLQDFLPGLPTEAHEVPRDNIISLPSSLAPYCKYSLVPSPVKVSSAGPVPVFYHPINCGLHIKTFFHIMAFKPIYSVVFYPGRENESLT
ncbi:Uncharacterized protein Fot_14256 [Forsythia ovata]|uniref:Uncharacterized protein n=1 Tax=Forsythia ovata TaxID=205694 RepID=A0ABD1W5T5_9LAMI